MEDGVVGLFFSQVIDFVGGLVRDGGYALFSTG
jgi:hypothetical protein